MLIKFHIKHQFMLLNKVVFLVQEHTEGGMYLLKDT